MTDTFTKLTYDAFQKSKTYFGVAHKTLSTQLLNWFNPPTPERKPQSLSAENLATLQTWLDQIIEIEWQDAQNGVYPESLLFENEWEDFFTYYPTFWFDMFTVQERANQKRYQEFAPNIDTDGYPKYYLQNFHHQTDGYLSDMSANLYDIQVDILFNGTADAMRRRVLAPLKQGLKSQFSTVAPKEIRVLDVACGTGRTLKYIRATLPKASLYGIDLSPAYLRKANQLLCEIPGELPQLVQGNAEKMPYVDDYFQGITSVFMFHELPPEARQNVIDECFRVLKPGGTFVICDSIQASDFPDMKTMMDNFPVMFHEPYYRHYTTDNLVERLENAGFEQITTQNHFVSKYWVAHKPI